MLTARWWRQMAPSMAALSHLANATSHSASLPARAHHAALVTKFLTAERDHHDEAARKATYVVEAMLVCSCSVCNRSVVIYQPNEMLVVKFC